LKKTRLVDGGGGYLKYFKSLGLDHNCWSRNLWESRRD